MMTDCLLYTSDAADEEDKNVMAKAPKTKADNENKDVNEEQNSNNETQA